MQMCHLNELSIYNDLQYKQQAYTNTCSSPGAIFAVYLLHGLQNDACHVFALNKKGAKLLEGFNERVYRKYAES